MYIDMLVLFNFLINFLLLLLTAALFRRRPGFWRLSAGALLGAVMVLVVYLPPLPGLQPAVVLLTPALMAVVVFRPPTPLQLFYMWGALFLTAFTVGGATLALAGRHGTSYALPPGLLIAAAACLLVYLLLGLLRPYMEERKWQQLLEATLLVSWRGKEKSIPALLDTGNRLHDPFTREPVIVVDYRCLEGLLPEGVFSSLSDPGVPPWTVLEKMDDLALVRSFTLLPCRGIGGGNLLLGFRPDRVAVRQGERCWNIDFRVVLGLNKRGFGPAAEYRALLPPDLMQAG